MLNSATPKRYDAICVRVAVNARPNMVAQCSRELKGEYRWRIEVRVVPEVRWMGWAALATGRHPSKHALATP